MKHLPLLALCALVASPASANFGDIDEQIEEAKAEIVYVAPETFEPAAEAQVACLAE